MKTIKTITLILVISASLFQGCQPASDHTSKISNDEMESLKKMALQVASENDSTNAYLIKFDQLDFDVFSNQKWDRLKVGNLFSIQGKHLKCLWQQWVFGKMVS